MAFQYHWWWYLNRYVCLFFFFVSINYSDYSFQSSLVANMLLGMLILRHRYSMNKFFSVIAITIGLILCTIEDYRLKYSLDYVDIFSSFLFFKFTNNHSITTTTSTTTIGITLLAASFLSSAAVGIYQEYLAKNFVKNSNEALFYVVSWNFFL